MSENDPWKDVERWDVAGTYVERMRVKFAGHPNGGWMRSTDIDAARAATEARHQQDRMRWASNLKDQHASHQQEITAKDETIGRWTQTGLTLMKFFAAFPVMNDSDLPEFLWREVPTLIRSARQAAATAEARLAAVEAERDRLKAALSQAAQDLETVGNDYPGSSCWQWCAERAGVARAALSGEGTAKP